MKFKNVLLASDFDGTLKNDSGVITPDVIDAIKHFIKEGGFSERMTAARVEEKRAQRKAVNEDAPSCPKCGGIMRVRHGKTGEFWGCVNYPACKGTRKIVASAAKEGL